MKQSTIFFGASSYVLPVIEFLNKNYRLSLVVTTEQKSTDPMVKYCSEQNIPYISVASLNNPQVTRQLSIIHSQFALLADFRLMIKQDILDIFPKGIINIHPSLLPEYRGPTPGTAAILDGKETTGVSLMLLDRQLDHGPLIGQEVEHILPADTQSTLYPRLFKKGTELLEKVLPEYLEGKIKPTEQDHDKATYTDFLTRHSGFIDLADINRLSELEIRNLKLEIARKVRAYFPWPGVWTLIRVKNKEERIKILPEKKVQIEGKKPVSYKDFVNGYPEGKEFLEKLGLV